MDKCLQKLSERLSQLEMPREKAIVGVCSPTQCGCLRSLKRLIVMIAAVLDESRPVSLQYQTVLRTFAVLASVARDPPNEVGCSWPV